MDPFPTSNRRAFLKVASATAALSAAPVYSAVAEDRPFKLNYILSSAMYGYTDVRKILPEVAKSGAQAIDLWPKVHGSQREQVAQMGTLRFRELLKEYESRLGAIACYRLGPFGLGDEMRFAAQVAGRGVVLVCTAKGPVGLEGPDLKAAVHRFAEQMKPHVQQAQETGCVIAIENHSGSLIRSPESIRWFGEKVTSADEATSKHLGICLAPHHLPQDGKLIGKIAEDLGAAVKFVYAQQHGMGSRKKMPKEQELLQMTRLR